MSRPTLFPEWATNANYAGGPDVGTPTKIVPSGGRIADGWRNTDVPPAQEENYERDLITQWLKYQDAPVMSTATMAALTGMQDNSVVVTPTRGPFRFVLGGTGLTADGVWLFTGVGGQWASVLLNLQINKLLPYIGPVPGETTTGATPAGRINQDFIPFGVQQLWNAAATQYTFTTATLPAPTVVKSMTGILSGDLVEFAGTGFLSNQVDFTVGMFVRENGGSWVSVSDPALGNALPVYVAVASPKSQAFPSSFGWLVTTGGTFDIGLAGFEAGGAVACTVTLNHWIARVMRP